MGKLMDGNITVIPVQVNQIMSKVDGSIKITAVTTTEIDPLEATILFSLANKLGYMGFSERAIVKEDFDNLPEIKPDFEGEKTPAQRMRGVLFKWWEQLGKPGDFELFYRRHYERMIDQVKSKLN